MPTHQKPPGENDIIEGDAAATGSEWRLLRRIANALRTSIARLLRVREEDKPQIYASVFPNAEVADLNYWLEIIFSIGIATLGLIINSPAVVIGAMLISPLMGPIIASGLAIALGDFYLGIKTAVNVVLSTLASILLAAMITWILPFHAPTAEILARTQPTLLDLGVAVLSGMAGAVVMCRGGRGGGITALPGVAVAVALMPPLGVVGFGVGIGWDWGIIRGGGLLYLTNLVAIIMSSFVVFFAVRMDSPEARRQINAWLEEQEKTEAFYEAIQRTPLRRLLGRVGSLPRRALILLIFLASVTWPLGETLNRLRLEAQIRRMAMEELHRVVPPEAIVREDLELSEERLRLRVVAVMPEGMSGERRRELQARIEARAGRPTQVTVLDVTTREELDQMTGKLRSQAPVEVESVEAFRTRLWARVRPAVALAWPAAQAPLLGYRVTFEAGAAAMRLHIVYLSERELGELGEGAVSQVLRERLGTAKLEVDFERRAPQVEIGFRPGSDAPTSEGGEKLAELARTLQDFAQAKATISIAAEPTGKSPSLDARRAEGIRTFLVETGKIAAERVETVKGTQTGAGARANRVIVRLGGTQP
jgi:uncharacterized hydrophobic protein (TIGR00271 family)